MALGFKEATEGEQGNFNRLSAEQKANYIQKHGWLENVSFSVVVDCDIERLINGQLESKHEYFERLLRESPDGLDIPGLPIYLYYDKGIKMRAKEYSIDTGEILKNYDLSLNNVVEFSRKKHIPYEEIYRVTIKNIKYGEILEV